MPYTRRILHYSPGPADFVSAISDRAIAGAWFELHRHGGCGAGELKLHDEFSDRNVINIGDWISFEYDTGDRWYLGRVESRQADSPAGTTYRLEGMGIELGEVFPGGFGRNVADGIPPHRYARTDLFPNDPDRASETVDAVSTPQDLMRLLMQQYVVPRSDILLVPAKIETPTQPASITSLKFRGEESVRSVVKEAAVRAQNASWGVDETGTFFFLKPPTTLAATFRVGSDLISLEEMLDRETIFNRVVLTGGYVYDAPVNSDVTARGFYRWRGNYLQPASRDQYGDRRIRIWIPWIRTATDSREFMREFFRVYAQPSTRYLVEVGNQTSLLRPWTGTVRLEDKNGNELVTRPIDTIRVQFDHAPRFRMEIGPADPRIRWPEPPHDERWELPENGNPFFGGDIVTFSLQSSSGFSLTSFDRISSSSSVGSAGSSMQSGSGGSGSAPGSSSASGSGSGSASGSSGSGSGSGSGSSSGSGSGGSGSSASGSGSGSSGSLSSGIGSGSSSSGTCTALDTFTGSGSLAAHTMDTGQTWTVDSGTLTLVGGRVQGNYPTPSGDKASAHFELGRSDATGTFTVNLKHNGGGLIAGGVLTRYADLNNYFLLLVASEGSGSIWEVNSGSAFLRANGAWGLGLGIDHPMEFAVTSTNITFGRVGGSSISYSSTTLNGNTKQGIRINNFHSSFPNDDEVRMDDLCVNTI